MRSENRWKADPVMDRLCVFIGQEEREELIAQDVTIRGQHFPAGTIVTITYDVYSFAPTENRPDRGPNKEQQTAHLYVKVHASERCSPPFIESSVEQLTTL